MFARARTLVLFLVVCAAVLAAVAALRQPTDAADTQPPVLRSQVVAWDDAQSQKADWGEMRSYFRGQTQGSKDVLTAVGVVQPGKAIHRAHRHAEEEYLALVAGSGKWSLAGKESPAKRGDILYAEPWVYHGFTNTGDEPLIFVVVRYSSKGVKAPPKPDAQPDEL
jgi:mannose-6-phosphate isomerase-like protein (cupin superfamily)